MKTLSGLILAGSLLAIGCGGGSSEAPHERLIGNWTYTNASDSAGVDLQFKTDGTYVAQVLQLTSTTTANDEVESGTFTATDSEIALTPQKYTCPEADPPYTLSYHFNGDSLVVVFPTGAIGMSRYTGPAATNFVVTMGCFQSDGSFVVSPLAPVGN